MKRLFIFLFASVMIQSVIAHEVTVNIVPDSYWSKRNPQCAVWIEDKDGNYIDTIFVTKSASKKLWKFAPKMGRPEALPVWYQASKSISDEKDSVKLDAITSATPKKSVTFSKDVSIKKGDKCIVKVEVNQSFDYNEKWTKENSGVNGQPSVIYSGTFVPSDERSEIELSIAGTGSVDGKTGKVLNETSSLTSAKQIVKKIYFAF